MIRRQKNRHQAGESDRRGLVLVIVMIVVVLVSLAGFSFVAVMFTEHKAVRLRGQQLEIEQAIASAELLIGTELQKSLQSPVGTSGGSGAAGLSLVEGSGLFDNPTMFQARSLIPGIEESGVIKFSVISPRQSASEASSGGTFGESLVRYGVEDESSRLNLAVLPEWERLSPGSGEAALMKLPGMTEEIARAILDWIDTDDLPRDLGAESEYYSTLDPPYSPRNATPESIEELLLVKGVTRKLLFGLDENRNGLIEEHEAELASNSASGGSADSTIGWERLLTLYSRDLNTNSAGRPRIYINDHDLPRLFLRLSEVEKSWGEFIVLYRQHGPALPTTPLPPAAETVTSLPPDLKVPPRFRIRSLLELIDAKVLIPAVDSKPSVLVASPFTSSPETLGLMVPKLLDALTIEHRFMVEGAINLNTASTEVLGMIPGLPVEAIERIVSSQDRVSGAVADERKTPAWLWTENVLSREAFETVLPYVTCRGTACRAQIVGYSSQSKLASRAEVVIDVSTPSPSRLYWKDLLIRGRGYDWGLIDPSLAEEEFPGMAQVAGN